MSVAAINLPDGRAAEWTNIVALMRARSAAQPDKLAVEVAGRALSWGELDRLSTRVAANLRALGVGQGDRVATMLHNSAEQVLTLFATARLGAVWAPFNVALGSQDLIHVVRDCTPKVLICDAETGATVDALPAEVRAMQPILMVGDDAGGARPFAELLGEAELGAEPDIAPQDPALIIYTGGTTGLPKGVVLPHFAVVAAGYRYVDGFGIGPDDRHYSVLQIFHVGGLFIGLVGPMVAGIPTHFERWFSASRFWPRVREVGATVIDPIGTMVSVLCAVPERPEDGDNPARVSLGVLSQVPVEVAQGFPRRFALDVVNVYSLTETGGTQIVTNRPGSSAPQANGKPWGWCEIAIMGEGDQPLPTGAVGEICLRPTVPWTFMLGYFNQPEKTVETFANLWLHTGDLGCVDAEGYLWFRGRQAHWLRIKGENVSAYEVENVLSAYPGVGEVVVVGVPAELGDEEARAFVIAEAGGTVDPAELVRWCAGRLAPFKVPRFVTFVDAFPRSSTKREVERHKLRDRPLDGDWDAVAVFGRQTVRRRNREEMS